MFSTGLIVSYELVVNDNEILGYLERMVGGMRATQETLTADTVRKVGPGGQFLKEPHTLREFKNEHWVPSINCRATFGRWMSKGGRDMARSAKEKTRKTFCEHRPQELPASKRQTLPNMVKYFETVC